MEKNEKKEEIPLLERREDGEVVDTATGQCPCCKDKFK